ncbi:hypothetical protein ANN_24758 [Periplaneta americana]|uniref:Transposase Tc1-like domain-containing protein n=1 Tax=Periplaneta americana TaxID=6978 RepID=A0ABQ8RZQ2_PERAM|nr:hypothetical protein ANN_24758 [Periplaneta americana]
MLTFEDDQFLRLQVLRNRRTTAARNRLEKVRGVNVSEWTVRRRLHEAGLISRRTAPGSDLTRQHRETCLQFAKEDQAWAEEQSPDGREKVLKRTGERHSPCKFSSWTAFHSRSVMVWAGINFTLLMDLVFVEGEFLTAHRYMKEILGEHVLSFASFIGDNFVLLEDNTRPRVARYVLQYLNEVGIQLKQWPSRSPDRNPMDHLCDI